MHYKAPFLVRNDSFKFPNITTSCETDTSKRSLSQQISGSPVAQNSTEERGKPSSVTQSSQATGMDVLEALWAQINTITDVLETTTNQEQRDQLRPSYAQAQLNFQMAVNKVYPTDDAKVAQLVTQMKQAQAEVERLMRESSDFPKIVDAVSNAVKVGTELAALAK